MQDDGLPEALPIRGRVSLQLLAGVRWLTLAGELVVVSAAFLWLRLQFPYAACLVVIGAAAVCNLAFGFSRAGPHSPLGGPGQEATVAAQLGLNLAQLAALLYLSGGVVNPFCVLLVVPPSLAAAMLRGHYALILGLAAVAVIIALGVWAEPLPWRGGPPPTPAPLYRLSAALALITGVGVTTAYAWWVAEEAARMELALHVTQQVLAREQRLSALGGLAAAAAHELGTPLATISVVAKEMALAAEGGAIRDDAELLLSQAERCREILRRLTEEPETDDAVHARMTLLQFLNEAIERHVHTDVRVEAVVAGAPGIPAPEIRRMPEVLHAMTSFVDNAVDFAQSEVLVRMGFDAESITVEVRDDGPGIASDVLLRLGQPYVTSRPGGEGSRSGHVGMGLGFFIAKTLLERTGATVDFRNARGGGALIAIRWPRQAIEAPPLPGGFELGVYEGAEFPAAESQTP